MNIYKFFVLYFHFNILQKLTTIRRYLVRKIGRVVKVIQISICRIVHHHRAIHSNSNRKNRQKHPLKQITIENYILKIGNVSIFNRIAGKAVKSTQYYVLSWRPLYSKSENKSKNGFSSEGKLTTLQKLYWYYDE